MLVLVLHVFVVVGPLSSNRQYSEINDWRITGKIIATAITLIYASLFLQFLQF